MNSTAATPRADGRSAIGPGTAFTTRGPDGPLERLIWTVTHVDSGTATAMTVGNIEQQFSLNQISILLTSDRTRQHGTPLPGARFQARSGKTLEWWIVRAALGGFVVAENDAGERRSFTLTFAAGLSARLGATCRRP
ncbi:hypothetical protein HQQ81_21185 [Microbacteriaceae bacterium VKM Ac-2854]|nr:hypothetical protein [Microbacteriaceae bacterium VKM Ac-2854]